MLQVNQPHLGFLFSQQGLWGQGCHHLPAVPVKKTDGQKFDPVSCRRRKEVTLAKG